MYLLSLNFLGRNAKGNNTNAKPHNQKISLVRIFSLITDIGLIIAVIPKTDAILNILEPIIFHKEIAFSLLSAAIIDVANSGTLVPIATIEMAYTR